MAIKVTRGDNEFYGFERTVLMPLLDRIRESEVKTIERFGTVWDVPSERKFSSLFEAQVYTDVLVTSSSFKEMFPDRSGRVIVKRSETVDAHTSGKFTIHLPDHSATTDSWMMRESIIWHELAHLISQSGSHAKKFQDSYFKVIDAAHGELFGHLVRILHQQASRR